MSFGHTTGLAYSRSYKLHFFEKTYGHVCLKPVMFENRRFCENGLFFCIKIDRFVIEIYSIKLRCN